MARGGTDALLERLGRDAALVEEQFAETHGIEIGDDFIVQTPTGARVHLQAVGEYRDPMLLQGVDGRRRRRSRRISSVARPVRLLRRRLRPARPAGVTAGVEDALAEFPAAKVADQPTSTATRSARSSTRSSTCSTRCWR